MRWKSITITVILLIASVYTIPFNVSATTSISNVSPANGAIHVDITNNPPDPGGYVTLSATIVDNTGNDDLEYWLDIWNGTAWINRQHLTGQSSPLNIQQDETSFNHTNTTYQWRILTLDHTDGTWNNQTFSFTTDKYPAPPVNPSPANNSHVNAGNIPLAVTVYHPDNDYGAKIYNVSFYEYPSGRLIGWNHTNAGWSNGTVVRCNQTYLAKYPGTNYYWYAKAFDDEYNTSSAIFKFTTNFTAVEPNSQYYSVGATIYTEAPYTRNEPDTVYSSLGAMVNVYYPPFLGYPNPANGSTNVSVNPNLGIWTYKGGEIGYWNLSFYANDTINETWHQVNGQVQTLLGFGANNQTIYDNLSAGTFYHTVKNDTGIILAHYEHSNTNYNANWQYYHILNIDSNGYSGYYQMRLNVSYLLGGDVDCNGHCQQDFDDLRFVQTDNSTELPYWIEKKVDGEYAIIWINVSSTAISNGKLLMYYGNPSASSTSNANSVFLRYTDKNDVNQWIANGYTIEQDDNSIYIHGSVGSGNAQYNFTNVSTSQYRIIFKTKSYHERCWNAWKDTLDKTFFGEWRSHPNNLDGIYYRASSSDYLLYNGFSTSKYYIYIAKVDSTNKKLYHYLYDSNYNLLASAENKSFSDTAGDGHLKYVTFSDGATSSSYQIDIWVRYIAVAIASDNAPSWNISRPYYSSGNRISPTYSLSGRAKTNEIDWDATIPSGTSLTVYYNISTNNGATWSGWKSVSNGGSISEIADGDIINNYLVKFKIELSTTDTTITPMLTNLTFNINRYTYVQVPYSGLKINTQYWWYVNITRETTTIQSNTYTFTTGLNETEPSTVYYSVGATIFTEAVYTLPEPYSSYYSMGAQIRVLYKIEFSNPIPANGSTGVTVTTPLLSIYVHSGTPKGAQITFQQNDSGNWTDIPPTIYITTNATVTNYHYQLQYGTTHYWRVKAYNASADKTYYSDIYHFTTEQYSDQEPTTIYYSMGATIYSEAPYLLSEPFTVYYSMGGFINVGKPSVSDPYPADGSSFGMHYLSNFSVYVTDPTNQSLRVSFYYANNNTCWATVTAQSGTRAETTKLPALTNGTTLNWYVTVNDTHGWNITSPTWSYTPINHAPTAIIRPQDGDNFIEVRRKFTQTWKPYVRLTANITDVEHDKLTIQIYIDDPTQPNWDDWILRFSHISDDYTTYHNHIYIQDELAFNQTNTQYHWWLHVEDEYGAYNDYYVNFTTRFMFYAYFDWTPEHPTNEDNVTLIDLSVNATRITWKANGETIATATYSSGTHPHFNITKKFNISNVYNITMIIYNASANVTERFYSGMPGSKGFLHVDRNLTINKTNTGAGYNYIAYHLNNDTDAKHFAENFSLERGWWAFKYDSANQSWWGYFLYPNVTDGTGDNFAIHRWDSIVVKADKNKKVRINITYPVNTSQRLQLVKGYNYISWSNATSTTSKNLSIGLQTGDWIYVYDTINDTWYGYWIGYAGDDFMVNSYKVLIVYPTASRSVVI